MVETNERQAWVQLPDPGEIRPSRQGYSFGFVPGMGRLLRAHPRIGRAFSTLFAEIMFSPEGVLSRREREMVAAVAAAAQDCTY
jgi:hypothetical protein